ncbi:MAG: glutamate--tRNA ligase [Nanoarchaeota archaeon]|nr:glutamate--tRNA ligase [Nanoarchaeota archaeon]
MDKQKIKAYVLENSISHDGKANPNAVIGHLIKAGLNKKDIQKTFPIINEIVQEINKLSLEDQQKEFNSLNKLVKKPEKKERTLPELENVTKDFTVRLAPYPSGDLHIGNARTYLLNAMYAEKYKGKIKLIMDDTIGSDEKQLIKEAYDLIPETFKLLGVKYSKPVIYKSSRLKIYYKYAEELIKLGQAYVCHCTQEEFHKLKVEMKECSCRQFPPKEQIKRWKQMFKQKQGQAVLRLKTDMQHRNPAFRDRVLFRISERPHPKVGKKFKVWPLLDFSWAIDDHLLKITHIIRGKDLMMESEMEKFIWDIFKWPHPEIIHSGMMRLEGIEGAKISKSKSQADVKSGKFTGWDDPRTFSIHSLIRRGILPESIKDFVKEVGLTQNDTIIPIENLYAINRKKIDNDADRYFFITDPIQLNIENQPQIKNIKIKLNHSKPKQRNISVDKIFISRNDYTQFKDKEIRLINLFNINLSENPQFTDTENKNIQKIQWVSKSVKTKILMENGNWIEGLADDGIKNLKPGQVIQFERFGFCRFDQTNKGYFEFWFSHK